MSSSIQKKGTEEPTGPTAAASTPDDLDFLNEPAAGATPPPATRTSPQPQPTGDKAASAASPQASAAKISPVTSNAYGDNSGLPTGIIVNSTTASPVPDGTSNGAAGPPIGIGNVGGGGGAGAASGQGGIDELPDDDVIIVFEDQQPTAGDPMINNATIAGSMVVIAVTLAWPFIFFDDSRGIDLLSSGVLLPACGAFLWAVKSPTQQQYVHIVNIWLKFFIGWAIMLPCAFLGAVGCLLFGILAVALFLGITGLGGWFAFIIISIVLVVAITFPEEFVKLIGAQRDNVRKNIQNPRQYVMYSIFSSLGMATFEAYIMVHSIRRLLDYGARVEASRYNSHHKANIGGGGGDHVRLTADPGVTSAPEMIRDSAMAMLMQAVTAAPGGATTSSGTTTASSTASSVAPDLVDSTDFVWLFVMCLVCIIPMHVLSGYHVGLGIARRDIMNVKSTMFGIVVIPVLFRSLFLYIIWFLPFITKWDEAGLLALLLIPMYVVLVKYDERKMPRSYLLRSGYLTAFGYGALPDEDEADQGQDMRQQQQQQNGGGGGAGDSSDEDDATEGQQQV